MIERHFKGNFDPEVLILNQIIFPTRGIQIIWLWDIYRDRPDRKNLNQSMVFIYLVDILCKEYSFYLKVFWWSNIYRSLKPLVIVITLLFPELPVVSICCLAICLSVPEKMQRMFHISNIMSLKTTIDQDTTILNTTIIEPTLGNNFYGVIVSGFQGLINGGK